MEGLPDYEADSDRMMCDGLPSLVIFWVGGLSYSNFLAFAVCIERGHQQLPHVGLFQEESL